MSQIADLAPEELQAQVRSCTRAIGAGDTVPAVHATLKTLLLEKERRHVIAFTDEQLAAAIARYQSKVEAGDRGAAMVLYRLQGGFINGTQRRVFYQSPPNGEKRETIAIGFVLTARDCELSFKLMLDDRAPLNVPPTQMAIPQGR